MRLRKKMQLKKMKLSRNRKGKINYENITFNSIIYIGFYHYTIFNGCIFIHYVNCFTNIFYRMAIFS